MSRTTAIIAIIAACAAAPQAATIVIDEQVEHQTIVGFGGSAAGWSQYASDLVSDLGVSVARYDFSGFTGVTLSSSKFLWDAGVRTFIGSCWSPPANMKSNNSTSNGGSLNTASYAAFVDWVVTKVNEFKQTTGGDLYALSIQNEPAFVEFYASCVYTPQQLRDVVKLVGQRFARDNIRTKLFLPEEVFDQFASLRAFIGVACSDTSVNRYVDALAFHGLGSDGISPSDLDVGNLKQLKGLADRFGKTNVWNTEAGGGDLALGRVIYKALRYADLNLWTKYDMCGNAEYDYYIKYGEKSKSFYVAKMFYRYLRPGAVRIEATSSDTNAVLAPVVFNDKTAHTLTLVFATGATATTARLQGANLPGQVHKYVTDGGSRNHEDQGMVSTGSDVTLEANAIITLVGSGYNPPAVGVVLPGAQNGSRVTRTLASATTDRLYSLDGRRLSAVDSRGVFVVSSGAATPARLRTRLRPAE